LICIRFIQNNDFFAVADSFPLYKPTTDMKQPLQTALAAVFFIGITITCTAQPKGGIPLAKTDSIKNKRLNISYATVSEAQKLDIYLPETGEGPFPVIVSIHGGAFRMGDKADIQLVPILEGLKRGYAVVSINYRLSGEAIFPAQIQDVKAAIRWIKANAKQYKLNADKLATWGGSAGGHLAAMAGTTGDVKELEDLSQGNEKYSSRVQAVVDWFGPINFNTMDAQFKVSGKGKTDHDYANSPESELVGKKITEAADLVKRANPATYITKDDPPFFIEHGTVDHLVPTEQSVDFAEELEKVLGKKKVTLQLLEGAGHGTPHFSTMENLNRVFNFLDKLLK
jgi:acetyl esterase/lipase